MKLKKVRPPRQFDIGKAGIVLSHVLDLFLEEDEVVEIKGQSMNKIGEITNKKWGMYLTPSINKNLLSNGIIIGILTVNKKKFIVSVKTSKMKDFMEYYSSIKADRVVWISNA